MSTARAQKGAGPASAPACCAVLVVPVPTDADYEEVRAVSQMLIDVGRLSLAALGGEEREHSFGYVLDSLDELEPRIARLRRLR